ncbi:hypothetical protein HYFRA_00007998 [Hymenoscyphus fraxineus]|uniref:Uncharacterized protein n=1 Tax=Hymenoscyphus fraxineus TaxID=746836 RepID=A0A9N9KNS1_9HELO|nr:hypothetical protein HYFRA_00007998 [Hymenoscyphus fraxineus]
MIIAAALVEADIVPSPKGRRIEIGDDTNFLELIRLAFLAFQFPGQIVTSQLLGLNEVPSTVLTIVYCDLAGDPHALAKDNVKWNRRVAGAISILVGGIMGGWISRSPDCGCYQDGDCDILVVFR